MLGSCISKFNDLVNESRLENKCVLVVQYR